NSTTWENLAIINIYTQLSKKTCQQLFGQNVKITNSLLIHIPRHQFFIPPCLPPSTLTDP
ncbi:MAG: hypothetical protein ACK468_03350, partial [Dolichospermum sp.]